MPFFFLSTFLLWFSDSKLTKTEIESLSQFLPLAELYELCNQSKRLRKETKESQTLDLVSFNYENRAKPIVT